MKLCNVLFLVSGQKNERICLEVSEIITTFALVMLRIHKIIDVNHGRITRKNEGNYDINESKL